MGNFFRNYAFPVATISGSIIGVGFFSLPYIALKTGIFVMLFYLVILTALVLFLHLIFAKISLKTPDFKRFPGFVGYFFGKKWELVAFFTAIFGLFGVQLAYLIVGGHFLTVILQPMLGGSFLIYLFFYFLILSAIIFWGTNSISKIEFWALALLTILLLMIFFRGLYYIDFKNFLIPSSGNFSDFFLPYGAILFSLWGTGLIPEVEEMLKGRKKLLFKVVAISTIIPAVLYLLFIFLILGITGSQTTESALVGLKTFFNNGFALLAIFIGVVTTFGAFIANGLYLKKMFIYDMKLNKLAASCLTCFAPIMLFLLGFDSFIPLISFIGGFFLGINGIFILLMYKKIGGKNYIIYPLSLVFIAGVIYEIIYFIK